ncbi:CRTAC1 family protein [Maritimibacter sp. HL-12]|uniref:CRTAC1 family protein n=1 Tax=Maritimibacter sp. HL-12 TaxID=1162418 RepID=UPI000A0F303F|nr:CRTAC1 family protein [Maritimibacter sp. HL-12]SMH44164.1 Repeat domain-containing protein [Maritimibacter sp. HL-12]
MLERTAVLILLPGIALADPAFRAVSVSDHVYAGGWEHFVGGGIAAFDCNDDLFPELFVAGGSNPATLFRNRTGVRADPTRLRPDTPDTLAITGVIGAYPLDIDSDGRLDLAVLRVGENLLLKGEPDCNFAPFEQDLGFHSDDRWTTSFTATWEQGQSLPTLAFGNYVDRTDPEGPFEACDINQLYRPENRAYSNPTVLEPGFCALSALFSDWNRQGRADLRLSNDRHYYVRGGEEQLWAMEPEPRLYTSEEGWQSYSLWGMGIASRDITGDGLPEVYLSSMADQLFQIREGDGPTWVPAPYSLGTSAQRPHLGDDGRPSTGWHIAFGDVNNDGRDDAFIAKGNVEQMPSNAMEDPNSLLIQGEDGVFREISVEAGVASMARSRGAALIDLNLDGRLDLAVVNRRVPLEVYQNAAEASGHWLEVALTQPGPNTRAVGAWIELRVDGRIHAREITVGGGHASGAAVPEHFGLGPAEKADLRVIWPDGATSDWIEVDADCILRVSRTADGLAIERL